jgi:protein-disulfide isomerase
VFRHFPLTTVHPHAAHAAEAAEAARGRFWDMHDVLYENQDALDDPDLLRYAAALGLDERRFADELGEEAYAGRVRADFLGGVRGGVNGTPTFFVNGARHDGPHDLGTLLDVVAAQLGDARR